MTRPTLSTPNLPLPRQIDLPLVGLEPGSLQYRAGKLFIIVSPPYREARLGWHMSISHPSRLPTWDEVVFYRYKLVPDGVTMAMYLPPMAEYVNLHEFCFHLHEERNP